jgi:hypothetical protein
LIQCHRWPTWSITQNVVCFNNYISFQNILPLGTKVV